jgi:polyamine oxidase
MSSIDNIERWNPNRALVATLLVGAADSNPMRRGSTCKQMKVAVLGAGMAGIIAAQTLHDNSISDFVIVEYNADIGG